jgi:hypothetical protein
LRSVCGRFSKSRIGPVGAFEARGVQIAARIKKGAANGTFFMQPALAEA